MTDYLKHKAHIFLEETGRTAGKLAVLIPGFVLISWLSDGRLLDALTSPTPTPAQLFVAAFLGAAIAAS